MSLLDKIPGRFNVRKPGSRAFSPMTARDREQFDAYVELALDRPADRIDYDKGSVYIGDQVVLTIEYAGTLGNPSIEPDATTKPLPRHRIDKSPLPQADHLKPFGKAARLFRGNPRKAPSPTRTKHGPQKP